MGERSSYEPGTFCAVDLASSDFDGSKAMPNPSQDYWGIYNGENMNGGMMPLPEASARPHWLVYFTSADLEASVETIGQLGGNVVVPPMPAGPGRIAVVEDPQGAFFALFEGEVDP